MAQDTSGAASGAGTLVVRGEMAARVDRLPLSWMHWEIAFIVQAAWAAMLATDGPALRLYPYIWEPRHLITSSQYSVLYAFEVGIGILIGGYGMGWLSDKIGRRNGLMISAVLAAPVDLDTARGNDTALNARFGAVASLPRNRLCAVEAKIAAGLEVDRYRLSAA